MNPSDGKMRPVEKRSELYVSFTSGMYKKTDKRPSRPKDKHKLATTQNIQILNCLITAVFPLKRKVNSVVG